jgi:hypothetical protein
VAANLDLVSEGFGLNRQQRGLLIRVGWVIIVTTYMAWTLGLMAFMGVSSPFATAGDLKEMERRMQDTIKQSTTPTNEGFKASIRANIAQLEENIDVAESKKAAFPSRWTELDQRMLTRDRQRLASQRDALATMLAAESAKTTR